MIDNIDIDKLLLKYKNWPVELMQSDEYILVITGQVEGNMNELFDLLKEISRNNNHNVSIK